jgi:hypothetical protein
MTTKKKPAPKPRPVMSAAEWARIGGKGPVPVAADVPAISANLGFLR